MHHGHRVPGRGGDHVKLRVDPSEGLLQHHHGEDGGARRHVPGARGHAVCGHHAGACVPLGRTDREAGPQKSAGVQEPCAVLGEGTRIGPGGQDLWQHVPQPPGNIILRKYLIKAVEHIYVKVTGHAVNGEHTRGLAHAHAVLPGEPPVYVSGQSSQVGELLYMALAEPYGPVQVGDAPALGDVEPEALCQQGGLLLGDGIAPGAELRKLPALPVKGQVAVHHGRDAKGAQGAQLCAEFRPCVLRKGLVGTLYACDSVL